MERNEKERAEDVFDEFPFSQKHTDSENWVSSARECTGLIPAMPASEEAMEMYAELFPFIPRAEKE